MKVRKDFYIRFFIYISTLLLSCSYILSGLYTLSILCVFISIFIYFFSNKDQALSVSNVNFLIFIVLCSLLIVPTLLVKEINVEYIKQFIIMLMMICTGYLLSESRPFSLVLSRVPFYLVSFYYFFLFLSGVPSSQFLENNSENFISVSLFLTFFLSFALSKKYKVEFHLVLMSGLIFFLSLISIGRSGIITSGFIFLSILLLYLNSGIIQLNNKLIRTLVYSLSFFVALLTVAILVDALINSGLVDRILNRGLTDYSREFIITSYLQYSKSALYLLSGVDFYNVSEFKKYGYNLHNSYLSIHGLFGFLFLVLYLFLAVLIIFCLLVGRNFVLLVVFVAILVRAITDVQILGGKLDWILFYLFFIQLKGNLAINK